MWSTWDLLTVASTSEPTGPKEEDDPDFSMDFSELRDPRAMRDFMSACDQCLSGDSDDGHSLDDEGYDPTRKCFHIDQEEHEGDNHPGMPRNNDAPAPASRVEIPRELAEARTPAGGQDTQLEQLREMQVKLDEEREQLMQLRQNLEQEWAGRALAGGARHRARDVQRRIIDDARAGLPPTFNGASQNLAPAVMLLRTMPELSTTEGRCVQGELKGLLENAAVQQAESSASRRRGCPSEHQDEPSRHVREASVHTEHTGEWTPAVLDRLGNEQHRRDRRARLEERVRQGYHPRRGGCYEEDSLDQPRGFIEPAGRGSGRSLTALNAVSAVFEMLSRPKDSAPRLPSWRLGASAMTRHPRTPQAYSSLGRAVHHHQSLEARDIQAGQRSRRGLQQRLEHRTTTSLLPSNVSSCSCISIPLHV
jgi:hypothetical protein